jgi:hypothetical protein
MEKFIKYLSALDWVLGSATIAYGLYAGPWWLVLVGCVGLLTAWYKPAVLFQNYLKKRFLAKSSKSTDTLQVQKAEEFYAGILTSEGSDPVASTDSFAEEEGVPGYQRSLSPGKFALGASRHNVLKPEHFNLFVSNQKTMLR